VTHYVGFKIAMNSIAPNIVLNRSAFLDLRLGHFGRASPAQPRARPRR